MKRELEALPRDGMRCSWSRALCLACVAALACPAAAFYLPGVAPVDYGAGAPMSIKVEALTSVKTQLPYEYYVLPFCHKGVDMRAQDALNLGEVLRGTRIYETPYKFNMGVDQTCKVLCRSVYDKEELQAFALMTEEEYRVNLLLDNLPIAMPVYLEETADDGATTGKTQKLYQTGYPIGHAPGQDEQVLQKALQRPSDKNLYLFNHLKFTVLYNDFHGPQKRRVVGFEVEPMSVKHTYDNQVDWDECVNEVSGLSGKCKLNTCDAKHPVSAQSIPLVLKPDAKTQEVIWTYDVSFKASPVRWSTRWDTYLQASGEADVHWFSILNSFSVVLFLSGIVAMIMVGAIRKDLQRYDSSTAIEEGNDETGWKLVHADVFRPPVLSGWLSVLVGSGIQLSVSGLFLIIFACMGFLSPANRGALTQAMLFLFVFTGTVGGYVSARFYRMFKFNKWRSNALWTAMLYPGMVFSIFFVLNLFIWGQKSSGAVPFGTLFALLFMWLGISVPLVLVGAFFGFRVQPIEHPVRVNSIPRHIPAQPFYANPVAALAVGGILPFGAVFVEVFYVLSSIWLHQFYYLFGFLFLVLLILFLTCCEVAIVLTYLQLCCEDYHWWWRSYFTSGSCAVYIFLYSLYYAKTQLQMARTVGTIMYISYMFIGSLSFFLILGSLGFLSCFLFVRVIYAAIKVD